MKYLKILIFLIGTITLFFSCKGEKKNIKTFYFPLEELGDGLVYEYRPVNNDTLPVEYWYYQFIKTDTSAFFVGKYYDHFFNVRQVSKEEIVHNGVLIDSYILYDLDSMNNVIQLPAEIISSNAFPFEVKDSNGVFLMELKWTYQKQPEISTTLVRNRRYKGNTKYTFKGVEKDCIQFDLIELVDNMNEGHFETEYQGMEIYAKDIGLIYYKKEIGENLLLEYELIDRYSFEEFKKKQRQ